MRKIIFVTCNKHHYIDHKMYFHQQLIWRYNYYFLYNKINFKEFDSLRKVMRVYIGTDEVIAPFAGLKFGWNWLKNTVLAELLWEKNTVPAEKTSRTNRIWGKPNMANVLKSQSTCIHRTTDVSAPFFLLAAGQTQFHFDEVHPFLIQRTI